jgi:hypothetical protein
LEAWSVSNFWLVVPWKVWKQVLHLMDWAAAFYMVMVNTDVQREVEGVDIRI